MIQELSSMTLAEPSWITFDTGALKDLFWFDTIGGLAFGSVYALIALGYTLVYGVLRLINFAHSEVFITGAFAAYFTFQLGGFEPGALPTAGAGKVVFWLVLSALFAALASGAAAVLVERIAYRPLRSRNANSLVFLITAIGASLVIQQIFRLWRGLNREPAIQILQPSEVFRIDGAPVFNTQIILVVSAIGLTIIVDQFIRRTRLGRGIRAVAQDPTTASLMGVNRERVIM